MLTNEVENASKIQMQTNPIQYFIDRFTVKPITAH